MKRGKKYSQSVAFIDPATKYSLTEAVTLARKASFAKFDESLEIHVRLNVDPRNAEQQVRGTVELPHGTGKNVRVAVFAQGEHAQAAQAAGAEAVGAADLAQKIQGGWIEFDACVATPDMMREVGKLGKVLGPRGLMPNPKTGTVTFDVAQAVASLKAGRVEYRVDRSGIAHSTVGKMKFTDRQLTENTAAYLDALLKARPASVKGAYVRSISISTTMGPGIRVQYET
ncbi:50S ribosomal protein L1 [Candidatus Sumerlaeota bacterium]|nr:50S ribosomal protein L1 [Candidatus Sumerlaeota bacterium]